MATVAEREMPAKQWTIAQPPDSLTLSEKYKKNSLTQKLCSFEGQTVCKQTEKTESFWEIR